MTKDGGRYALLIGIDYKEKDEEKKKYFERLLTPEEDVQKIRGLLENPDIGNFTKVVVPPNNEFSSLKTQIAKFYANRKASDLLLFYFAGHGAIGRKGRFVFVASNTEKDFLDAQGIKGEDVLEDMNYSRARRQIIILDCCFSGAFGSGRSRGEEQQQMVQEFDQQDHSKDKKKGRFIMASSEETRLAREVSVKDSAGKDQVISVFSSVLIEGLESGNADYDPRNGKIAIDEMYKYICTTLIERKAKQSPTKNDLSWYEGDPFIIAKNPRHALPIVTPSKQELSLSAKLDKLLTHFGITPEIGTESVVKEEDKSTLKQAVQTFEKALFEDLSHLDPEMLIKTGLAHRELGEYTEAIRYYRVSLQIKESFRAFLHLGYDLHTLERFKEAIECFEKANAINPEDVYALMNWGYTLTKLDRFDEAIEKYKRADIIQPDDALNLLNWGVALHHLGQFDKAIEKYKRADIIQPRHAKTLVNWGYTLDQLGRFDEAIEKYQYIDTIHPKNALNLLYWGITLKNLGRFDEAIEKYKRSDNIKPKHAQTLMSWGLALHHLGRFDKAIEKYKRADSIRPRHALTLMNWGYTLDQLGRFDEAIEKYQYIDTIHPKNALNLLYWGITLKNLGRFDEAIEKYKRSDNIKPKHAQTLMSWGITLKNLGRFDEAIEKYKRADSIQPEHTSTLMNWGVALEDLERFDEAIEKYQQVDVIRPDDALNLMNWGVALYELGRFNEAIEKYQQADTIRPGNTKTLVNWGLVLKHLGRYEEAIEKYIKAATAFRAVGDTNAAEYYDKWIRKLLPKV